MRTLQPKTHLISIAISTYPHLNNLPPLRNALNDANAISDLLSEKYKVEPCIKIHEADVTEININREISRLKERTNIEDALILLYNGHGELRGEKLYWLFEQSRKEQVSTWFNCEHLFEELGNLEVKDIIVIVNSCYSGNLHSQEAINSKHADEGKGKSRILFTSSLKNQTVADTSIDNHKHSPFADAILEMLRKNTTNHKLSIQNIAAYVHIKLKKSNIDSTSRCGTFTGDEIGEFVLFLKQDEHTAWQETTKKNKTEAYEDFIDKFPASSYCEDAQQKIKELKQSLKAWLHLLDTIQKGTVEFQKEHPITPYYIEQANTIKNTAEDYKTPLIKEQKEQNAWDELCKVVKDTHSIIEKIAHYESFIEENPYNSYIGQAQNKVDYLRIDANTETAWNAILPKPTKPETRLIAVENFIFKYEFSKQINKAIKLQQDITDYIEALKSYRQSSKEGLKKYVNTHGRKAEYYIEAGKKLKELDFNQNAVETTTKLYQAKEQSDVNKVKEILIKIEKYTNKKEKKANQTTYEEGKTWIIKYEAKRRNDFKEALSDNNVEKVQIFLRIYSKDASAKELLDKIQGKLEELDEIYFLKAEETRDLNDFKKYCELFVNGIHYSEAESRIAEISFFNKLIHTEEYQDYLNQYPNGLMVNEAKEKVSNHEKQEQFLKASKSDSIEVCQDYLDDFVEVKDESWNTIKIRKDALESNRKDNQLFEAIQTLIGTEQLELCKQYTHQFKDGIHITGVKKIEEKLKVEIERSNSLESAIEEMNISALERLKPLASAPDLIMINDHIDYLKAKELMSFDLFSKYQIKYGEKGTNNFKVIDGMNFIKALDSNQIEELEVYIASSSEKVFIHEAKQKVAELKQKVTIEEAYQKAIEEGTIFYYNEYMRKFRGHNLGNDKVIEDKKRELRTRQKDDEEFSRAEEKGIEAAFIEYIKKYGMDGRNYHKTMNHLSELRTEGITKDVSISQGVIELQNTILESPKIQYKPNQTLKVLLLFGVVLIAVLLVISLIIFIYLDVQ